MERVSTYTIGQGKTQLSKLVREAEAGKEVVLRRGSEPVARIVAIDAGERVRRVPGRMSGRVVISDDFEQWPDDVARALGMTA